MRQWTPQERKRQAELIHEWQPWKHLPPKSEKARAASRRNALKHGAWSEEVRAMRRQLRQSRMLLKLLAELGKVEKKSPSGSTGAGPPFINDGYVKIWGAATYPREPAK